MNGTERGVEHKQLVLSSKVYLGRMSNFVTSLFHSMQSRRNRFRLRGILLISELNVAFTFFPAPFFQRP